jgi:hypothetical protein
MIVNVLTVDVEEYYHAAIFRRGANPLPGAAFESRVERSMDLLLDVLRRNRTRATFFVLGEVAAAHPRLVRTLDMRMCTARVPTSFVTTSVKRRHRLKRPSASP